MWTLFRKALFKGPIPRGNLTRSKAYLYYGLRPYGSESRRAVMLLDGRLPPARDYRVILKRVQRDKNSGRPLLNEEDAPNPSTKNLLNKPVNDVESLQSRQPTHILRVLRDGGPGEGAFFKKPLPPEILYA